jgi:electron transfer flavoprotein alpha subunit
VRIVFVLLQMEDPGLSAFWDLISPVREEGDRVEFWLPGPESPAPENPWAPAPDLVVYGAAGGAEIRDLRCYESLLRRLEGLYAEKKPDLILFPGTLGGHELAVRLAARIGCGCFPETRTLLRGGKGLTARKKVCGSNLDWEAEIPDYPAVLTVTGGRRARNGGEGGFPRMECRPMEPLSLPRWILEYGQSESPPSRALESAPLIFAAGRGLGSRAACERLRRVAGRFGAPLGFSRPAALNGWGDPGEIIGQSGIRSGAEVCVAVGASGAAAFMAGIEAVPTLIAVNPDKNAPVFRYADIGIIGGAEEFIAALEAETGSR